MINKTWKSNLKFMKRRKRSSSKSHNRSAFARSKDQTQFIHSTGILLVLMLCMFYILLELPASFTGWDKTNLRGYIKNWKKNIKQKPVWDSDNWLFNYIAHPYAGAVYFMVPISNNFSNSVSFFIQYLHQQYYGNMA